MSYRMLIAPRLMLAMVGASLVVVAACSDRQEPTSPTVTAPTRSRSVDGATGVTTSAVRVPGAKPTDQVGFTTVAYVESSPYTVAPGGRLQGFAVCPAESGVVSGGSLAFATTNAFGVDSIFTIGADAALDIRSFVSNYTVGSSPVFQLAWTTSRRSQVTSS